MATHPNDAAARTLYDNRSTPAPKGAEPDTIITGRLTPARTTPDAAKVVYGGSVLQQHIDRLMADNLSHAPGSSTQAEQAKEGQFWADIGQKTSRTAAAARRAAMLERLDPCDPGRPE